MKPLKRLKNSTKQEMIAHTTKLISITSKAIRLLLPSQDGEPSPQQCYSITKYINKMNNISDILAVSASKTKDKSKSKKPLELPAQNPGTAAPSQPEIKAKTIIKEAHSSEKTTRVEKKKVVSVNNESSPCKLKKISSPVGPEVIVLDVTAQKKVVNLNDKARSDDLIILDDSDDAVVIILPPKITKKRAHTVNERETEHSSRASTIAESEISIISHSSSRPDVIVIDDYAIKKVSEVKNVSQSTTSKAQVGRRLNKLSPDSVCKFCLKAFPTDILLHKKTCNVTSDLCTVDLFMEKSDHPCPCCSIVLHSSHNLRLHLNAIHSRKIPVCMCHGCKKNFLSFVKLDSHLSKIKNEKCSVECEGCNTKFKSVIQLRYHVKVKHLKKSGVECPVCSKRFGGKKDLAVHMADRHKDVRTFKCPKCEKAFGHESRLTDHLKYSVCSGKLFPCTVCEKSYQARGSLARHLRFIHKLGMQDVNKNPVSAISTGIAVFEEHAPDQDELSIIPPIQDEFIITKTASAITKTASESQDVVKKRKIKLKASIEGVCKFCLQHFPTVTLLSKHKKVCWPNFTSDLCTLDLLEEKGQHTCPCCSRCVTLSSSHALRNHFNTCHSTRFPVCTCHYCNKNFTTFSKLDEHIAKSEKCYLECKTCHQQYRSISTLRGHVSVKHYGKGGLSCPICKKVFNIKTNLDIHLSTMHKEARPYKCIKCQKGFSHPVLLTKHMSRSKCSGRTFPCQVCGKGYHAYTSFIIHLKQIHELNMRQYKTYLKGKGIISL